MARNTEALKVRIWGQNASTLLTPEAAGLDRNDGWPDPYGVDQFPPLGVFNQVWREFSAALVEIAERGILPWDAAQRYEHDPTVSDFAFVVASDGRLYQSVQPSGGSDPSRNPILDTTHTYWRPLIDTTSGRIGPVENNVLEAGTNNQDFVTAAALLSLFEADPHTRWRGTSSVWGLSRFGSRPQIEGGSASLAVNGDVLMAILNDLSFTPPNSSTTERGLIRTATLQEHRDGTASSPAATPEGVAEAIANQKATLLDRTTELAAGQHDFTLQNVAQYATLEFLLPETDRAFYGRVPRAQLGLPSGALYLVDVITDRLYSVDPTTGQATQIGDLNGPPTPLGLASHNGTLYLVEGGGTDRLYSVDPTTGQATQIGNLNGPTTPLGLASHNGTLYLVDSGTDRLYSVDPTTGQATQIGNLNGPTNPEGLASHNGTLYLVDSGTDRLYSVDPTTGQATQIGSLNGPTNPEGLASHNGTLYLVDDNTDRLYSVDPTTGQATQIGNLNGPTAPSGLASHAIAPAIAPSLRAYLSGTTLTVQNSRALSYLQVNGLR